MSNNGERTNQLELVVKMDLTRQKRFGNVCEQLGLKSDLNRATEVAIDLLIQSVHQIMTGKEILAARVNNGGNIKGKYYKIKIPLLNGGSVELMPIRAGRAFKRKKRKAQRRIVIV